MKPMCSGSSTEKAAICGGRLGPDLEWSKEVESTTLEAARSSTRGSGWGCGGLSLPLGEPNRPEPARRA
eukprot:scaffold81165_cov21-Phaeocystis_antarctica.AAC.1